MSRFRRFELIEEPFCYSSPLFYSETLTFPSIIEDSLDLDLFKLPSPFDAVTDLVCVDRTPSFALRRVQRVERQLGTDLCLQSLCDRVAALESRFDRFLDVKSGGGGGDRKYTWTKEIKGAEKNGFDRKYKWEAEIAEEEKNLKLKSVAKNIKWTAEIKGKGEDSGSSRKYTFQVESGDAEKKEKEKKEKVKEKKEVKEKKQGSGLRIVEIQEPTDHRTVVLRQVG